MQLLRTINGFVRVLVALFVVSQFAGIVSSPLASARYFSTAVAFHLDHHHAQHADSQGLLRHHNVQGEDGVDHCCALHAFFAGVLPPVVAIEALAGGSQRLDADLIDIGPGVASGQLDRSPRPYDVI
jgi:hypothetical protein